MAKATRADKVARAAKRLAGRRYVLGWKQQEQRAGKWYPTEDAPKPAKRAHKPTAAKLRSTITPGTVLILLAGRFKGKRVVFLRQLESGLLLVTGPFALNGVPLRRVNQAYVIATSTKVDVSGVDSTGVTDALLAAKAERKAKSETLAKDAAGFFAAAKAAKGETSEERKALQKKVDDALTGRLDETLKAYLKARFSLTKSSKPHAMKF